MIMDNAKTKKPDTHAKEEAERRRQERKLEQGLEDSFPGSDPVSVTQPSRSPTDKRDERHRKGE
jgi:hypothetical protein